MSYEKWKSAPILFGASSTSTTLVRYFFPGGVFAVASATPQCETLTHDTTFSSMTADITTAGVGTGGGNTFTYVLCTVDASDVVTATDLTLTLDGDVKFGSASVTVSLAAGTRITVRVTPAGTVTSWGNCNIALGVAQ